MLKLGATNINIIDPKKIFKFRGIAVSPLLKNFGISPGVTEITFVCYDAYYVTLKIEDLLKYPIILALAKDNKPIQRDQSELIYLIFTYTQYPELRQKYNERFWAFLSIVPINH